MSSNNYHFITHWRVQGTAQEVYDILSDAPDLMRWWPAVYLDVQELTSGDESGVGKVVDLYTTGWLPYTIRWQFQVIQSQPPYRFTIAAMGDFVGQGVWDLAEDGGWVHIRYDWRIQADKPLFRWFSFILKPFFAANHTWAMRQGEASLKLELARRKANSAAARNAIPMPPGPTTISSIPGILTGVSAMLLLGWLLRRIR